MIVDSAGKSIYFKPYRENTTNLQALTYQGEPVLAFWKALDIAPGYGEWGDYKILDADYHEVATVRPGNGLWGDHHEFVLTPQGTALFTCYFSHPYDLSPFGGPANGILLDSYFQEVDVATGQLLMQWQASDHVEISESYAPVPTSASTPYDFFHINSIDVDSDDNLLISGRHCFCVYKLDRSTGDIIWRLHGKHSDFKMGQGSRFSWQHHVRHHPGHQLTIFDNGLGLHIKKEKHSRGIKLKLHYDTMTCDLVQAYEPHPKVLANSQGSVQVLANGNVFVGWGFRPYFSEYRADGKLLYCGELPAESYSYRAFRAAWPPT